MCNVNSIHDRQTTSEGCHVLAWGRAERERDRERERETDLQKERKSNRERKRDLKISMDFQCSLNSREKFLGALHMLIDHYKRYLPASYLNGTYKSMPLSVHVA